MESGWNLSDQGIAKVLSMKTKNILPIIGITIRNS